MSVGLDPRHRVGVGTFHGCAHPLVADVEVLGADQVGDPGDGELLLDPLVGGHDDKLGAERREALGVPVEHVHERGTQVAASPQSQDHDGISGGVGKRRERCLKDRRRGEEQAPVRLEHDHLFGR